MKTHSRCATTRCLCVLGAFLLPAQVICGQTPSSASASESGEKAVIEAKSAAPSEEQRWLFHLQGTEIIQGQPGFHSPYQGPNSLSPHDTLRQSSSFDLYLGARLWEGGALYFNPEFFQGFGFANTHGVADFLNAEAYKVGKHQGDIYIPHLYFQQVFGLGGEQEKIEGDLLQLAETVDVSRITFTAGRLSVGDQFDANAYAHSARTQFLNWALNDAGAFDYAADSLGAIEGATLELNQKQWALRYGIFDVPRVSNGEAKDGHFDKAWQQVLEWEGRYALAGHPGKVRLLGWLERAHMGSYRETISKPALMADITATERYRYQYGFELNLEQEITPDLGGFVRLSWRDGQAEVWQFTDIDESASLGFQWKGSAWGRAQDKLGVAGIVSGLSAAHKEYLAAGGLGPIIGDGQLKHYGTEDVLEAYYDTEVAKHVHLAVDYQLVVNPAYNEDRGPMNIFSARLHFEF